MANQTLTYQDKLDMINYFEKHRPDLQDLAERFNVGKIQAANIIKNRETIMKKGPKDVRQPNEPKRKDFFSPQGKIIDTSCYEWYLKCIREDEPVSGKLIKDKAIEIARSLQHHGFCASNGWLQKWRVRHNVNLKLLNKTEADTSIHEKPRANGTVTKKPSLQTVDIKKVAPKQIKKRKFGVKLDFLSKPPKKSLDRVDFEEDFDPLSLPQVSYGDNDIQSSIDVDDDDDVIFDGEGKNLFKINSYASALNAIQDLKNFAQDDDVALKYLNLIEGHFQKERLK